MKQPTSTFKTALWFIPLAACVLAGICVFILWFGYQVLNKFVLPPEEQPDLSAVSSQTDAPVSAQVQFSLPAKWAEFQTEIIKCLAGGAQKETCSWQAENGRVVFTFHKPSQEVVRRVYRVAPEEGAPQDDTHLISQTLLTSQGKVRAYGENNTVWKFDEDGNLTDILTGKGDNRLASETDPHDTYTYNKAGKMVACSCWEDETCCAIAPDLQNFPRTYCAMFSPDDYVCPR